MKWLTNEIMFYAGLIIVIFCVIISIIYFVLYKFKKVKLSNQLSKEYGDSIVSTAHRTKK